MATPQGPKPGSTDLVVASLQGGYNDTSPLAALADDQCAAAQNVEFFNSTIGERRAGCDPLDVTGAGFNGTATLTTFAPSATSWGAIAITLTPNGTIGNDSGAVGGFSNSVSSFTHAYTVGTNGNYLLVAVLGDASSDLITGVTFNGVSMTQLKKFNSGIGWMYLYGLAAPATGSHNVVVSASGSCSVLGFLAASYQNTASSEPDSSLTNTAVGSTSITTVDAPAGQNRWAIQFSFGLQGLQTSVIGGIIRASSSVSGALPTLSWTGTSSGSQNYGSVTTPLAFTAGTYTLTVSGGSLTLTFQGTAGGGGGGGAVLGSNTGAGGGGGATTTGTSVTLVAGKSYTLTIGAGGTGGTGSGAVGTAGGATTLVNTTDSVTLISLNGGGGASGVNAVVGGTGGTVATGSNPIVGGVGGAGILGVVAGNNGGNATNGAGGGGSGGWATVANGGGNGGNGSVGGGAGGTFNANGTSVSGSGGTFATDGFGTGGGGGGGAGGAKFGISGDLANGAGGGGGGGGSASSGSASGNGGAGGNGLGAFIFVQGGGAGFATLMDSNGPIAAAGSIVHLSTWNPTNDIDNPELWAVGATPNSSTQPAIVARRTALNTGAFQWFQVLPVDPIIPFSPDIYQIQSVALDGLKYFAYNSGVDRLHVWEPATQTLRRTGLLQPLAAPTAADEGSGTYAATKRFYRTRWIEKQGTTVVRRSEPSLAVTFTPSGSGAGVTVTNSGVINEGETHWEVEVSLDGSTFYRLAQVAVATTTYTDTALTTTYSTNVLSEAIGAYLLQPAARYLTVDGDRLILAGHFSNPALQSTVSVTPVSADPGVGSGERLPIVTTGGQAITTSYTLDNYTGGPVTGLASGLLLPVAYSATAPVSVVYVFKWSRIYMLVGSGNVTNPYNVTVVSTTRGAIPGSIFRGMDEYGSACIYFLDPQLGPSRIGYNGLQLVGGLRRTWKRVNLHAFTDGACACGVWYPYKRQAHFWVAADSNITPTLRLVLQVPDAASNSKIDISRGWALWTGRSAQALCATTYQEYVSENGNLLLSERPLIGLTNPDFIQRCDVDSTDAGQAYSAILTTKPFIQYGILAKWEAMVGSLLANANAGASIVIRLIRDFGVETTAPITVSLAPTATESEVIKIIDNLALSGAGAIQIQFSDT